MVLPLRIILTSRRERICHDLFKTNDVSVSVWNMSGTTIAHILLAERAR